MVLVAGSPGGPTIISTVLQIVVNVIDHQMTASQAVAAPRIHHQWLPNDLELEREIGNDVRAGLTRRGHKLAALEGAGFFGPDSWYMNAERNLEYAAKAKDGGRLSLPVLFLHGAYDYTCETVDSRLAEPMRRDCRNLTEVVVPSGHSMAQERPRMVNAELAKWLATQLPPLW